MSWFDGSGLKSFALSAFNEAQKHIDKVLDIQEEENAAKMAIRDKKQRKDDNKKEEVSTTASSTREKVSIASPSSKIASSPTRRPGKKKSEKSTTTPKKESSDFSWDSLFADEPKSLPTLEAEAGDEMSSKRASSPRKRVGSRTSVEKRAEARVEEKVDVAAEKTEVEIRKDGDDVITLKTDDERAIESVESDAVVLPVKKEEEEEEEEREEEVSVTSASSEIEGIHPMEIKEENIEKEAEAGEENSLNERAGEEEEKEKEDDEELSVQAKEEIVTSDPIQTITDKVDEAEIDSPRPDPPQAKKNKELDELRELVGIRENQLFSARKENVDLQEANSILRNQLAQLEEVRASDNTDIDQLTKEFTDRVSATERKFKAAVQERDQLRKLLQEQERDAKEKYESEVTSLGVLLKEKTEQIDGLMKEGENLSKQQLQNSTVIKKLRAKNKQNQQLVESQNNDIERLQQEVKLLEENLAKKTEDEIKYQDAVAKLNEMCERQNSELVSLRSDHEDTTEKFRGLQMNLDTTYKELAELRKAQAVNESTAQKAALAAEVQAREELKIALDQQRVQSQRREEALLAQIEDLQHGIRRAEQQAARREENFRQEISDLQQRLQEGESRNQELSQSVSLATTPLLRQIENLQNAHKSQATAWEKVEKNLTDRLSDLNSKMVTIAEKERQANERILELQARLQSSDSQLASNRQEKSRLAAQVEVLQARCELSDERAAKEKARCDTLQGEQVRLLDDLRREKILLEQQVDQEKGKTAALQHKLLAVSQQQEVLMSRQQSTPSTPSSPSPASVKYLRLPSQGEILERSLHWDDDADGSRPLGSSSAIGGSSSPALQAVVENLQALVKQKEGEVHSLQSEMVRLEKTKGSMGEELVALTTKNDELAERVSSLDEIASKYQDMEQRHNAVLQMYGEKEEQVEELRLDLEDVKTMYRTQINELLAQKS